MLPTDEEAKQFPLFKQAEFLCNAGWFFPAYIQIGRVKKIVSEVQEAAPDHKQEVLERHVVSLYEPLSLASMMVDRYPITPFVKEFKNVISQAIEAYCSGLTLAATSALIPVIEGVIRRMAQYHGLPGRRADGLEAALTAVQAKLYQNNVGAFDELYVMLYGYKRFFKERFFEATERAPTQETLNRHGVLHGVFDGNGPGSAYDFCRLISAIDLMAFVISLDPPPGEPWISAFHPDVTGKSAQLGGYYEQLRAVVPKTREQTRMMVAASPDKPLHEVLRSAK